MGLHFLKRMKLTSGNPHNPADIVIHLFFTVHSKGHAMNITAFESKIQRLLTLIFLHQVPATKDLHANNPFTIFPGCFKYLNNLFGSTIHSDTVGINPG